MYKNDLEKYNAILSYLEENETKTLIKYATLPFPPKVTDVEPFLTSIFMKYEFISGINTYTLSYSGKPVISAIVAGERKILPDNLTADQKQMVNEIMNDITDYQQFSRKWPETQISGRYGDVYSPSISSSLAIERGISLEDIKQILTALYSVNRTVVDPHLVHRITNGKDSFHIESKVSFQKNLILPTNPKLSDVVNEKAKKIHGDLQKFVQKDVNQENKQAKQQRKFKL